MPGSTADGAGARGPQRTITMKGLTPGLAFTLAPCCTPVPGDRIVGIRRPHQPVEVHTIECPVLSHADADEWIDLAWGDGSEGGTVRLEVVVRNEPGSLGVMAGILGQQHANIVNLTLAERDPAFHSFQVLIEVDGVQHLMRILAALRAADAVSSAERMEAQLAVAAE